MFDIDLKPFKAVLAIAERQRTDGPWMDFTDRRESRVGTK